MLALVLGVAGFSAQAVTFAPTYYSDNEEAGAGLFDNPAARATLDEAAAYLGSYLTSTLSSASTKHYDGPSGNRVTLNLQLVVEHPLAGRGNLRYPDPISSPVPFTLEENTIYLHVGSRPMTIFGQSSLAQLGNQWAADGTAGATEAANAANTAAAQWIRSENAPIMEIYTTAGLYNHEIQVGPSVATLWIDGDGVPDWHFSSEGTPLSEGQYDLRTAVLRELLLAVGAGTSYSFEQLLATPGIPADGLRDWLGEDGIAANGGDGTNLITVENGRGYISEGILSPRLSDGAPQRPLLSVTPPGIAGSGDEGRELTELDLAILRDIGWNTPASVPEPSCLAALGVLLAWRRRRA